MTSDKSLIKRRFEAQLSRYDRLALVQQQICEQLSQMLFHCITEPPKRILELGIGTGFLTRLVAKEYCNATLFLNDIAQGTKYYADKYVNSNTSQYVWGDAETVDFPSGLDLITSASTVQWFDELPAFIKKCAAASSEQSYLAITTFGKQNFKQIKQLTGQGLEYYTTEQLTQIIESCGYTITGTHEYIKEMTFDSPNEVLRHIKATGVNGLKQTHWTRQSLQKFEQEYRELCPRQITLTYHPIIIVAKIG